MRAIWLAAALCATAAAATEPAERGKAVFANCMACHSLQPRQHLAGPSLYRLFGRRAGTQEGYRYSGALRRSAVVWDEHTLDAYLADPQRYLPANRMAFSGIADGAERAALIAYLRVAGQQ